MTAYRQFIDDHRPFLYYLPSFFVVTRFLTKGKTSTCPRKFRKVQQVEEIQPFGYCVIHYFSRITWTDIGFIPDWVPDMVTFLAWSSMHQYYHTLKDM